MTAKHSLDTHPRTLRRLAKERNRRKRTLQRRLNVEQLEWRNLLAGVTDAVDSDVLAVPTLYEEAPAAEVALWSADTPVVSEATGRETKVLDEEGMMPVEISLFSALDSSDGEMTDAMPMLMAFGAVEDGTAETTAAMPMLMTVTVAEDGTDDAGSDVPVRIYSLAGPNETTQADDGENLQAASDSGAEPVLLSESPADTDTAPTDADPTPEIMLMAAMGPSPFQNQDEPVDVNTDGSTTPVDALLVINRVNEGVSLPALAAAHEAYMVDVNGDRSLDATDAIQVINRLNTDDQSLASADVASRVAPIWYDGGLNDTTVPQDTVTAEETVNTDFSDTSATQDAALLVARPITIKEVQPDASSEVAEKPDAGADESLLFSEKVDWLQPDLL